MPDMLRSRLGRLPNVSDNLPKIDKSESLSWHHKSISPYSAAILRFTCEPHAHRMNSMPVLVPPTAGHLNPSLVHSLWTNPGFDHCMFDILPSLDPDKLARFQKALFGMRWEVPEHRPLLELEGLKEWMPPREEAYDNLRAALSRSANGS